MAVVRARAALKRREPNDDWKALLDAMFYVLSGLKASQTPPQAPTFSLIWDTMGLIGDAWSIGDEVNVTLGDEGVTLPPQSRYSSVTGRWRANAQWAYASSRLADIQPKLASAHQSGA